MSNNPLWWLQYIRLMKDCVDISPIQAEELIEEFMKEFPKVKEWQKKVKENSYVQR